MPAEVVDHPADTPSSQHATHTEPCEGADAPQDQTSLPALVNISQSNLAVPAVPTIDDTGEHTASNGIFSSIQTTLSDTPKLCEPIVSHTIFSHIFTSSGYNPCTAHVGSLDRRISS